MIKCPNCSGEMSFDPTLQMVKCRYCDSLFTPEEINEKAKAVEEKAEDSYEGKTYRCSQCGATLMTFDDTAITFCSYCGSQAMLADKMVTNHNPDFVIPFQKTKEECIEAYKQKVSKFKFAPNSMKSDIVVDKFRGIYMPYVIYNLKKNENFLNKGSKYAYRRGDYIYYYDYSITADADISYDGISYDLVSKFYDNYSTAIPFNAKEAVPFEPGYMAGYYADALDVNENVYLEVANELVRPDAELRLKKYKEFSKYGCSSPKIILKGDKKIGMFPAYFLALRDNNNQTVSYAVVNGQTGKVAVDLPIDFKKYVWGSLIASFFIFILINILFVLTPIKVNVISIILGFVSLIISYYQVKKIRMKENHEDDRGVNYTKEKKSIPVKQPKTLFKEAFKNYFPISTIFFFFGFAIAVAMFNMNGLIAFRNTVLITVATGFGFPALLANLEIRSNEKKIKTHKEFQKGGSKYATKQREDERLNRRKDFRFLYKEILAIVISLAVYFSHFASDAYYYGAGIVSLVLIVLSFYDLVREHNMLTTHKLPQLEKRGGDENA